MKKTPLYLIALVALVLVGSLMLAVSHPPVHATTTCPVTGDTNCLSGWAWSSNVGWISFNSSDAGAGGGPYDVSYDSATGNLGGYAWSSNVGWISFKASDLSVAPACSGVTQAHVDSTSGAVVGWARVISEQGRSDGWDGCVELSGTNHATNVADGTGGVTYVPSASSIVGYAWGNVIGWLQFSPTLSDGSIIDTCVSLGTCPTANPGLGFSVSSGNGTWSPATTITADQNGIATAYIKWMPVSVSGVKVADQNWNSVQTVGKTTSPSGYSFSSASPNTDAVVLSNSGSASPVTKSLSLGYIDTSFRLVKQRVDVTINPYQAVTTNCSQPANTNSCAVWSGAPSSRTIHANVSQCVATGSTVACEFYCKDGFSLKNGSCVKSSIQEI